MWFVRHIYHSAQTYWRGSCHIITHQTSHYGVWGDDAKRPGRFIPGKCQRKKEPHADAIFRIALLCINQNTVHPVSYRVSCSLLVLPQNLTRPHAGLERDISCSVIMRSLHEINTHCGDHVRPPSVCMCVLNRELLHVFLFNVISGSCTTSVDIPKFGKNRTTRTTILHVLHTFQIAPRKKLALHIHSKHLWNKTCVTQLTHTQWEPPPPAKYSMGKFYFGAYQFNITNTWQYTSTM